MFLYLNKVLLNTQTIYIPLLRISIKRGPTWKKPATKADPHLSRCILNMEPPVFTFTPPVSKVTP